MGAGALPDPVSLGGATAAVALQIPICTSDVHKKTGAARGGSGCEFETGKRARLGFGLAAWLGRVDHVHAGLLELVAVVGLLVDVFHLLVELDDLATRVAEDDDATKAAVESGEALPLSRRFFFRSFFADSWPSPGS